MNKELPKISIITPSYNQVHFLEQAILSVLSQKYPALDILLLTEVLQMVVSRLFANMGNNSLIG
jgi:cellulose synthase/poly-beta-1,6-N-acetylglucosamine synthase-like glycosyltransferase